MKNLLLILIATCLFAACSKEEPQKFSLEILPVESFILPDTLVLGTTHVFKIKYKRPSNCHYFEGFYYKRSLNERTVAISISVLQDNCTPLTGTPVEVELKFLASNNGTYIFKFYKGKDSAGNNLFVSDTIPVKN